MSVDRLTSKRDWIEAGKDLSHEYGYSHIWRRLKQVEDILGDTYDLGRLRELVENPPRLDRSAWEPCAKCCDEPDNETMRIYFPSNWDGGIGFEYEEALFCPRCGRPLTDAACDMLEKRLESAKP